MPAEFIDLISLRLCFFLTIWHLDSPLGTKKLPVTEGTPFTSLVRKLFYKQLWVWTCLGFAYHPHRTPPHAAVSAGTLIQTLRLMVSDHQRPYATQSGCLINIQLAQLIPLLKFTQRDIHSSNTTLSQVKCLFKAFPCLWWDLNPKPTSYIQNVSSWAELHLPSVLQVVLLGAPSNSSCLSYFPSELLMIR